jgi:preprotein translocase subunit SecA
VSEFDSIYKLPVAVVPPNRQLLRQDNPDVVFRLEQYKWKVGEQYSWGQGQYFPAT